MYNFIKKELRAKMFNNQVLLIFILELAGIGILTKNRDRDSKNRDNPARSGLGYRSRPIIYSSIIFLKFFRKNFIENNVIFKIFNF